MNRVQKKIIKEALDSPEILDKWEYDFINNIAEKDDSYELSAKQNSIINRIGNRIAEL